MKFFIRILLISFPCIALAVLLWPVVEGHDFSFSRASSALISKVQDPEKKQLITVPATQKAPPENADHQIYRWVDEHGRTVYSDRADHPEAKVYVPKKLSQLKVTGLPEPRIEHRGDPAPDMERTHKFTAAQQSLRSVPSSVPYEFSMTSASWEGEYVVLSGRIAAGAECRQLEVRASAKSDAGGRIRGTDVVSYNGFGSTLYEIRKKARTRINGRRPWWEPQSTSARCLD